MPGIQVVWHKGSYKPVFDSSWIVPIGADVIAHRVVTVPWEGQTVILAFYDLAGEGGDWQFVYGPGPDHMLVKPAMARIDDCGGTDKAMLVYAPWGSQWVVKRGGKLLNGVKRVFKVEVDGRGRVKVD